MVLPESYSIGPAFARGLQGLAYRPAYFGLASEKKRRPAPTYVAWTRPQIGDTQSDVTLIEDITQESSSRHLAAHCLEEGLESSSESVAEQPSPTETDTALVGELHQKAQNAVGLVSRASQENTRKEVSALQPLLQASLIRAFLTQPTADRKDLRLFLGGLLLALHGGLRSVTPDFILPVLTNLGGLSRPSSTYAQPMAYSQSLAATRHFLTIPWQDSTKPIPVTPPESRASTLHSLKVCLLAAGAQVRATEEARQHQGHRKSPSVQLYSRDDTILALDLQRKICLACAQGWRPARPIARGGQPPTLEPPFHVDRSQPKPAYQVSSFGAGVSRFVYSREADLESPAIQQGPEVSQEPQPGCRADLTTSQIPADDTEALLVEIRHTAHPIRKTSLRKLPNLSSPHSAYFVMGRGE
ncbi:hypothetical protein AK812_SmicGene36827 [Symbiodinium microadriaticum]|uniref:Uncharacterized protein n=1 Tax=Symbiodinium microadriaticum TaxID=2951 RepID=A0A1Q9CHW2_SYMMI|nr:hypothetical protein AK812_SmicGene36827 [Symbiodinium microadriaticum]